MAFRASSVPSDSAQSASHTAVSASSCLARQNPPPALRRFRVLLEAPEEIALAELPAGARMEETDRRHPELHDRGYMHFAAARPRRLGGAGKLARRLHALGVAIDAVDALGQTPLFFAAREGNEDCSEFLVRRGCDVNHRDKHGQTALFYAGREGHLELLQVLCRLGACPGTADAVGQTALFYIAREGHATCAEFIVRSGCAVNHCDRRGQTALFYAAMRNQVETITELAKLGADLSVADLIGRMAATYAPSRPTRRAIEQAAEGNGAGAARGPGRQPEVPSSVARPSETQDAKSTPCAGGLDEQYSEDLGLPDLVSARRSPVVLLRGLLSSSEIVAVLEAVAERARSLGSVSRDAKGQHQLAGCWTTHYLHTEQWFQKTFSTLYERLATAVVKADEERWGLLKAAPCARRLGQPVARTVELHTVGAGGNLADPAHFDSGSLWTLDMMLSSPGASFDGGAFQTPELDGSLRHYDFGLGDAVAFVSHKPHCVAPVTAGCRQVLVIEFWHGEARACAHRCTQRWGSCGHDLALSRRQRVTNAGAPVAAQLVEELVEQGFGLPAFGPEEPSVAVRRPFDDGNTL